MKKFLPLAILTLFILTACGSRLAKQPADEVTTMVDPSESVSTESSADESTNADVDALDDIVVAPQISGLKCSNLKNSENREACDTQVSDLAISMLMSEILSSLDDKRCKELPDPIAADCELQVAETGVQGPVSDDELSLFNEIVQGDLPGVNGEGEIPPLYPVYTSSKCAELATPGYKKHCEDRVSVQIQFVELDQIVQSGDLSRCDSLAEAFSVQCKQFFGIDVPLPGADEGLLEEGTVPPGAEVVQ